MQRGIIFVQNIYKTKYAKYDNVGLITNSYMSTSGEAVQSPMECMSRLMQLFSGSSGVPLRGHYQMRECAPIILSDNISSPLSN